MKHKVIVAAGAALLLALGSAGAMARHGMGGGGGGGHFHMGGMGGARMGGMRMGHMGGMRSFGVRPYVGGRSLSRNYYVGRGAGYYGRGHHRRGGRGFYVGLPYYGYYGGDYYGYDYGYGGGCGWLYRQAIRTGSPYWWRRYELCAD